MSMLPTNPGMGPREMERGLAVCIVSCFIEAIRDLVEP